MRTDSTQAENILWQAIRNRQLDGYKFKRQVPIENYIADFVCFEARLIIELDGEQHGSDPAVAYDEARTHFLHQEGFLVIRFPNHEVHRGFDAVREVIAHHLQHTPHPPPS